MMAQRDTASWLMLVHQFPQDPGALRVKIWRRLQSIGAVAIKNSIYVLPLNDQTQEDFEWVLRELEAGGADGAIFETRLVDGMTDQQVQALFDAARDEDYTTLAGELRTALADLPQPPLEDSKLREFQARLKKFRRKLADIEAIDFFGASSRLGAQGLVDTLASRLHGDTKPSNKEPDMEIPNLDDLRGRVWVTRRGVRVDRIASAWFVRRWVDPDAVFKFTGNKNYRPSDREVRFDMFDAEFTHEGDQCTFEVLLRRSGISDPALQQIAEIVHDIDLKDGKFGHEETAGIANILNGIAVGIEDDDQRIARGSALFNDLYHAFKASRS